MSKIHYHYLSNFLWKVNLKQYKQEDPAKLFNSLVEIVCNNKQRLDGWPGKGQRFLTNGNLEYARLVG